MKKLVKVEEVAERLGVAKSWVYRKVKEGVIPTVANTGRYIRFNPDDIESIFFSSSLKTESKESRKCAGYKPKEDLWPV